MYYFVAFFAAYAMGIIFCVYFDVLYLLITALIYTAVYFIINRKLLFNILIVLFIILSIITINYNSKSYLIQYINERVEIVAKVTGIYSDKNDSKYVGYNVTVTSVNELETNEKSIIYVEKNQNISLNSIIKANAEVSDIAANKNRMLFNYKSSLRNDKIFTTLFSSGNVLTLQNDYSMLNSIAINTKQYIETLFRKYMSEDNANIVLSIILGSTKYLDADMYGSIQRTGMAHVFAVSGLHIGIIYEAIINVLMSIGLRRRLSIVMAWGLLWVYGFVIGFPISVLRSLFMFNIIFGAEVLYRKYNSVNSIVVSGLILLIINPYYLFEVGFLLSYMAAFSLAIYNIYIKPKIKCQNKLLHSLIIYTVVQIYTFPILSYCFNYVSVIGIVFNALLVPLFSIVVMLALAAIPVSVMCIYAVVIPLRAMNYMLNTVSFIINEGAGIRFSGFGIASMSVYHIIYYYLFVVLIMFLAVNKKLMYKKIIFAGFSVFFTVDLIIMPLKFNGLRLNIVDVGQGLFINMSYKGHNFIFDAGSNTENIGKYVISPYLIKNGLKSIDIIFISHFHNDHIGGINHILSDCNVDKIYTSHFDENNLINEKYSILNYNNILELNDEISIEILWPDKEYESSNENNMSNVYLIKAGSIKLLLAGDIEKEVENKISDRLSNVDILVVPHHGSNTSSGDEFVNAVKPKVAVFSYGINNYGIPSENVINRYKETGSSIISTFNHGEINFMVIDDEIYYNTYTGFQSENMKQIYLYNFILDAIVLIIILSCILKNKRYISDKYYEGYYEL